MGCCCLNDNDDYKFYLEIRNWPLNKYTITLYYIGKNTNNYEISYVLENLEKKEGLKEFINMINKILEYISRKEPNNNLYLDVKFVFKRLFQSFLNDIEISNHLENIEIIFNDISKIYNFKDLISLLELIYSKKREIKNRELMNFIERIKYILERYELLEEDEIVFFVDQLKEIFIDKNDIEKILINNYENFSQRDTNTNFNDEKIKFMEELENKSVNSLNSFSSYSENSQKQIMKMEKEIRKLNLELNKTKRDNENKRLLKLIFYNQKENEEYFLNIFINEEDKFSLIIDQLYEKYPDLEDKEIKKFLFNEKKIKRNELIKDIKFYDISKIYIEHYN